jgi:hypothetical protein
VRFLAWGAMPLGALLGGFLADFAGVVPTLWIAAIGMSTAVGWTLLSPLRTTRELPATVADHG